MTLRLPEQPREPSRAPFPIIAVIAPVVAAVVIGAIIRSPYVLVFAALGPVIAIASTLEARRAARRERRAEATRFDRDCAHFLDELNAAHADERSGAADRAHGAGRVVIGWAPHRSVVLADAVRPSAPSDVADRLAALAARAATNPRMPVLLPEGRVVVEGAGPVAERLRLLVSPAGHDESPGERSPDRPRVVIDGLDAIEVHVPGRAPVRARPVLPFIAELRARAERARARTLPDDVPWEACAARATGASLPIGLGAMGVVSLDLVADGPHVLVGGATGSGKSEFLRALALSAADRPETWSVLFVDFKGGATFDDLCVLPATVGLITDLDAALAERALGSLRAEIRRRERVLRDHGARDIAALLGSGVGERRLLIVVDEYAALLDAHPQLQPVFADISARGRSLGVHLVLCTQRPAGVVHDGIAVNCALRVLFRTTDATDARALLGAPQDDLDRAPRGRAQVRVDGRVHPVQIARIAPADVDTVAARTTGPDGERSRPWAEPLPSRLGGDDAAVRAARVATAGRRGELLVGMLDDVDAQRWAPATWIPDRDGALAIIGCAGSGRTTALARLAEAAADAGWRVLVLPETLPDAVSALQRWAAAPFPPGAPAALLVADRFAELLASASPDEAALLLACWDTAARQVHAHGGGAAADCGGATASARLLPGRFGMRLVLRCADDDEHRLAGAPRGSYDHRAPAGRGWWRRHAVQVIAPSAALPSPQPPSLPTVRAVDGPLAVVSSRPDAARARLERGPSARRTMSLAGGDTPVLGGPAATIEGGPSVVIDTPEAWQRDFRALAQAKRAATLVLDGLDPADARTILGARAQAPPIEAGELLLVRRGSAGAPSVERARW